MVSIFEYFVYEKEMTRTIRRKFRNCNKIIVYKKKMLSQENVRKKWNFPEKSGIFKIYGNKTNESIFVHFQPYRS